MLSIIGNALLTATRLDRPKPEQRDHWAGRFVPPSERMDENKRLNVYKHLRW